MREDLERLLRVPVRRLRQRAERLVVDATGVVHVQATVIVGRSEEHTSELQSLMRISYAVLCLKKKTVTNYNTYNQFYQTTDNVYKNQTHNYTSTNRYKQ